MIPVRVLPHKKEVILYQATDKFIDKGLQIMHNSDWYIVKNQRGDITFRLLTPYTKPNIGYIKECLLNKIPFTTKGLEIIKNIQLKYNSMIKSNPQLFEDMMKSVIFKETDTIIGRLMGHSLLTDIEGYKPYDLCFVGYPPGTFIMDTQMRPSNVGVGIFHDLKHKIFSKGIDPKDITLSFKALYYEIDYM